jgi:hypothetical protein
VWLELCSLVSSGRIENNWYIPNDVTNWVSVVAIVAVVGTIFTCVVGTLLSCKFGANREELILT